MNALRTTVIPVAAWSLTLAALATFGGLLIEPPFWVRWLSVAIFAVLLPITTWAPARDYFLRAAGARGTQFITTASVATAVTLAGGGVGSLMTLALVCPLALALEWFGRDRTAWLTLALFGAALLLDVFVVGRPVAVESALVSLLGISAILLAAAPYTFGGPHWGPGRAAALATPAGATSRQNGADPLNPGPAPDEPVRLTVASNGSTQVGAGVAPAATGSGAAEGTAPSPWTERGSQSATDVAVPMPHSDADVLAKRRQIGSRQWWRTGADNRVVAEYLLDVRGSTAADEAVVWLLNEGDSVLRPLAACSSNEWAERTNADQKWIALVRWSCEAAVLQVGVLDDGRGYVTAPLQMDGRVLGVLCLRRRARFDEDAEHLKSRAAHHASHIARLSSLVQMHASSIARSDALDSALDAVRELQDHAPVESPSGAICDAILHVCGCDASALVRWHSEVVSGTVEAGAGAFESIEQNAVQSASIVGSTCQRATPFRLGAAHDLLSRLSLFRQDETMGSLGALSVQPMRRDGEVIGALVAAWNSPTDLTAHTAPSMEVLASVASHALHAAWKLETVQAAARTDALTGLSNRRYLDEQLIRVLAEAGRYGDPASLILLDLDYFKKINDTHGHAVGDMVLKHVAETLLDGIRGVDVCARYGGEELAVLLPRTGLQGAVELAERLRLMVESRPLAVTGGAIRITASFGVASFPTPASNPTALLSSADGALYRAKEAGRNRVRSALPVH